VALVVLTAVAIAVGAPQAWAGGSWLELQDGDRVLISGQTVTMSGTFGSGQQAGVSAGPWHAELRADHEQGSPVPLGPVTITEGARWGWRAAVTFTVPSVATGEYSVTVLNEEGEGVGDLIGGFVQVAPSLEAWRVSLLRQRIERQQRVSRKEIATIRDRLGGVRVDLAAATATRDELAGRVEDLERALDDTRDAAAADDPASSPWPVAAAVFTALALLLVLAGAFRRHAAHPAPTSWMPGERSIEP
jgi:hypothetical protein